MKDTNERTTKRLTATFLFHGMGDYWSGNGRRWDDDAGCLFAYYGNETTLAELIDEWVNEFNGGGDCDNMPEDITDVDVREALIEMLSDQGRKDLKSDKPCEFALELEEPISEDDESPVAIVLIECIKEEI